VVFHAATRVAGLLRPEEGARLVYRVNITRKDHRYFQVDLTNGAKSPAFDHEALAQALAKAAGKDVRAEALPLVDLDVTPDPGSIRFRAFGKGWRFDGAKKELFPDDVSPQDAGLLAPVDAARVRSRSRGPTQLTIENGTAGEIEMFWLEDGGQRKSYGKIVPGKSVTQGTYAGHVWILTDASGSDLAGGVAKETPSVARVTGMVEPAPRPDKKSGDESPDGQWRAVIRNHNLAIQPVAGGEAVSLTNDGTRNDGYDGPLQWSPDSRTLIAWRAKEVSVRQIHIVQSSPPDQLQPKLLTLDYAKPGDSIRQPKPRLFDIAGRKEIPVADALFDNPWEITDAAWCPDSTEFSPDHKWIIDKWSRVDQPQVVEVRRADNGKPITELERADDSALRQTGWSRPERFSAKGRDGLTDIYGIIIRPTRFDPAKKYPVLEDIYAGSQDHFVPKNYGAWSHKNAMAELGFIVVSIDGMGTNWRSKAFHDVCWKNLADSGFPDRIPWIKAAAATRPWMDLSRVGIYGGSAGGQSTLAGLLHHGDFYQVGVADCGCHDNRMDKIWWNEAWMGWPVGESYARNSNVTHAAKLTGKLLLVVGECDHNVDPASTAQVVTALQKAGKYYELLTVMNSDHGSAETPYGNWRRADFLVRNLHAEQ